jgi:hypothetical protein
MRRGVIRRYRGEASKRVVIPFGRLFISSPPKKVFFVWSPRLDGRDKNEISKMPVSKSRWVDVLW